MPTTNPPAADALCESGSRRPGRALHPRSGNPREARAGQAFQRWGLVLCCAGEHNGDGALVQDRNRLRIQHLTMCKDIFFERTTSRLPSSSPVPGVPGETPFRAEV